MRKIYTFLSLTLISFGINAQNNIQISATDNWVGYVNVFDMPQDGGGYLFGSSWGLGDLKSTADAATNTLTLQPNFNTYADNPTDPYWVNQTTLEGNKIIEASTYVEAGPALNDNDLTFYGDVLSYTLDTSYQVFFFIKALDSLNGYQDALGGSKITPLPSVGAGGNPSFSVTATAAEIPAGLIVQYGFTVRGRNGNPLNEQALGSVVLGVQPNVSTINLDDSEINVYPNPASNVLNISSKSTLENIEIFSLTGNKVISSINNKIDISSLKEGMYTVNITSAEGNTVKRFIKR